MTLETKASLRKINPPDSTTSIHRIAFDPGTVSLRARRKSTTARIAAMSSRSRAPASAGSNVPSASQSTDTRDSGSIHPAALSAK